MRRNTFTDWTRLLNRKVVPVYIFSSMRSGSTMLKSLLATAPDISHLPEVNFQKFTRWNSWRIKLLSDKDIIVLKQPAGYHHIDYPRYFEQKYMKKIILVRDVTDTVHSLVEMNKQINPSRNETWSVDRLVHDYWCRTYEGILSKVDQEDLNTILVKYENLISDPITITGEIFGFLGSAQKEGTDEYHSPADFSWKWGKDDGGELIRSLKVQRKDSLTMKNLELAEIVNASRRVKILRNKLGYVEM